MDSHKLSQKTSTFIISSIQQAISWLFQSREKLTEKEAQSLSILFAKQELRTFFISISKEVVALYLQSWNILVWNQAAPLMFVALQEYKPKSPEFLGLSVSVPTSCAEFTPYTICRPSLNQVKFARGLASAEHLRVVTFLIHDCNNGFEEAVLLMRGLSKHSGKEEKFFNRYSCVWICF